MINESRSSVISFTNKCDEESVYVNCDHHELMSRLKRIFTINLNLIEELERVKTERLNKKK